METALPPPALRRRLLERVADEDTPRHLSLPDAAGPAAPWRPWLPGVARRVLLADTGTCSYLLRLAPGAEIPAHRHAADEECVVLQGELEIGPSLRLGPGSWHLARAGALHTRIRAPQGALIYLRGAPPHADDVLG